MRSRNKPSQREAVGDVSRMRLLARGKAYCELADEPSVPRAVLFVEAQRCVDDKGEGRRTEMEAMWMTR